MNSCLIYKYFEYEESIISQFRPGAFINLFHKEGLSKRIMSTSYVPQSMHKACVSRSLMKLPPLHTEEQERKPSSKIKTDGAYKTSII